MNNLLLTNGILFFVTGVLFASSKGMQDWQPYVWWAGSIIWTYRYLSYRKHGFLRVDSSTIQINHANWKGREVIHKQNISKIDFTTKAFIIILDNGKKIKIHKGSLMKEMIPEFEEILNADYEKQILHNNIKVL